MRSEVASGVGYGAIGGAASAFFNSKVDQLLGGDTPAALQTTISMLTAGGLAAVAGVNVQGAMTAAENETLNNYLNHRRPSPMTPSEQERSDRVAAACSSGDSDACKAARQWDALSRKRNADLASACAGNFGSPACRSQVAAALAAGNDVHAVNGTMYAFDPNVPAIKSLPDSYQAAYAGSFDGQAAQSTAQALPMAPVELPFAVVLGRLFGSGAGDASAVGAATVTSRGPSASSLIPTAGDVDLANVYDAQVQGTAPSSTASVFDTGANITPMSSANKYRFIGANGTFVTPMSSIESVTGPISPTATEVTISQTQATALENALGLNPGSLESSNVLSIVNGVSSRAPRSPLSGNNFFLGGGQGLPGGGAELVIDSIPSAGGQGIRQITVKVK